MPLHSINYMLSICVQNLLKLSCRCKHRSHYDILKVSKNCSTKEIKESFIELSKKFHPDVNSGKKSHSDFLRISEAYNVLSRPLARSKYDAELAIRLQESTWPRKDIDPETWTDSSLYNARRWAASEKPRPYYGIPGIKKGPHVWIVALCLTTAGLALIIEIFLISRASRKTREHMVLQTKAGEDALASVRAEAARFGNEIQFERLRMRANLKTPVPISTAVVTNTQIESINSIPKSVLPGNTETPGDLSTSSGNTAKPGSTSNAGNTAKPGLIAKLTEQSSSATN